MSSCGPCASDMSRGASDMSCCPCLVRCVCVYYCGGMSYSCSVLSQVGER